MRKIINVEMSEVAFSQYYISFHNLYNMEPTCLKFGALIKRLEIITPCFSEKFDFPNRKRNKEMKRDYRGAFSNPQIPINF